MDMSRPTHNNTRNCLNDYSSLTTITYILFTGALVIIFAGIGCCYIYRTSENTVADPLLDYKMA